MPLQSRWRAGGSPSEEGRVITLEASHMVINPADFSERYQMWNSWNEVSSSETCEKIIKWTANVARRAPRGTLRNLVINSHGSPHHRPRLRSLERPGVPRLGRSHR